MAVFEGTPEEFNTYLNDYVKNKVPVLTKKYKTGNCQFCHTRKATDAAHKHGRERSVIIREAFDTAVLNEKNDLFRIDLNIFSEYIKKMHSNPDNFYFLCSECHRNYDAGNINKSQKIHSCAIPTKKQTVNLTTKDRNTVSFEEYLRLRHYAEGAVNGYAVRMPSYLMKHEYIDIYKITDEKQIRELLKTLETKTYFQQAEKNGNKLYSNGLKRYAEFRAWRNA